MKTSDPAQQLLARASQLRQSGRVAEAISAYRQLLALRPDLPDSWYNLAWLERQAGRFADALSSYAEALRRGVSGAEEVHLNRAVILADHLARSEEAKAELETALRINPNYVPALLNLGNLHEDRGRRDEARAAYEQALALDPGNPLALARLAGVTKVAGPDDPVLPRLRSALARSPDPHDRADLGFALGRALDAAGDYDAAFAAYAAANRDYRAATGAQYDPAAHEALIDRIIAAFPAVDPAAAPAAAGKDGAAPPADAAAGRPRPIFVCGMFRSGSTLAEQILACHSKVVAGGEIDLLPALIDRELSPYPQGAAALPPEKRAALRAAYLDGLYALHPHADRVTDKRPDNFLHIGLIRALFPEAPIVHTVREPLDNILSIWFLQLDPSMSYAFDLDDVSHWHGQYRRLMAHWKSLWPADIFDVDYDALVADPQRAIAGLLAYCGLDWDDACLSFHEADNAVRTASVWQVREPFYRRSSGRWRHYGRHLESVRRRLKD